MYRFFLASITLTFLGLSLCCEPEQHVGEIQIVLDGNNSVTLSQLLEGGKQKVIKIDENFGNSSITEYIKQNAYGEKYTPSNGQKIVISGHLLESARNGTINGIPSDVVHVLRQLIDILEPRKENDRTDGSQSTKSKSAIGNPKVVRKSYFSYGQKDSAKDQTAKQRQRYEPGGIIYESQKTIQEPELPIIKTSTRAKNPTNFDGKLQTRKDKDIVVPKSNINRNKNDPEHTDVFKNTETNGKSVNSRQQNKKSPYSLLQVPNHKSKKQNHDKVMTDEILKKTSDSSVSNTKETTKDEQPRDWKESFKSKSSKTRDSSLQGGQVVRQFFGDFTGAADLKSLSNSKQTSKHKLTDGVLNLHKTILNLLLSDKGNNKPVNIAKKKNRNETPRRPSDGNMRGRDRAKPTSKPPVEMSKRRTTESPKKIFPKLKKKIDRALSRTRHLDEMKKASRRKKLLKDSLPEVVKGNNMLLASISELGKKGDKKNGYYENKLRYTDNYKEILKERLRGNGIGYVVQEAVPTTTAGTIVVVNQLSVQNKNKTEADQYQSLSNRFNSKTNIVGSDHLLMDAGLSQMQQSNTDPPSTVKESVTEITRAYTTAEPVDYTLSETEYKAAFKYADINKKEVQKQSIEHSFLPSRQEHGKTSSRGIPNGKVIRTIEFVHPSTGQSKHTGKTSHSVNTAKPKVLDARVDHKQSDKKKTVDTNYISPYGRLFNKNVHVKPANTHVTFSNTNKFRFKTANNRFPVSNKFQSSAKNSAIQKADMPTVFGDQPSATAQRPKPSFMKKIMSGGTKQTPSIRVSKNIPKKARNSSLKSNYKKTILFDIPSARPESIYKHRYNMKTKTVKRQKMNKIINDAGKTSVDLLHSRGIGYPSAPSQDNGGNDHIGWKSVDLHQFKSSNKYQYKPPNKNDHRQDRPSQHPIHLPQHRENSRYHYAPEQINSMHNKENVAIKKTTPLKSVNRFESRHVPQEMGHQAHSFKPTDAPLFGWKAEYQNRKNERTTTHAPVDIFQYKSHRRFRYKHNPEHVRFDKTSPSPMDIPRHQGGSRYRKRRPPKSHYVSAFDTWKMDQEKKRNVRITKPFKRLGIGGRQTPMPSPHRILANTQNDWRNSNNQRTSNNQRNSINQRNLINQRNANNQVSNLNNQRDQGFHDHHHNHDHGNMHYDLQNHNPRRASQFRNHQSHSQTNHHSSAHHRNAKSNVPSLPKHVPKTNISWKTRTPNGLEFDEFAKVHKSGDLIYIISDRVPPNSGLQKSSTLMDFHRGKMIIRFDVSQNGNQVCFVTKMSTTSSNTQKELKERAKSKVLDMGEGWIYYAERTSHLKNLNKVGGRAFYRFCKNAILSDNVYELVQDPSGDAGAVSFKASGLVSASEPGFSIPMEIILEENVNLERKSQILN